MEPQQPESDSNSFEAQSPYAPPPSDLSNAAIPFVAKEYAAPFPFRLTFFSACLATAALVVLFLIGMNTPIGGFIVFLMPLVSIAVFVSACMHHFEAGGAKALTAGWKTLMILLIPVASLLLFVPTCFGTGLGMFVVLSGLGNYGGGETPVIIMIPFFAGYLATFAVIALRLRYTMPKPTVEQPGPWTAIK